MSERVKLNEAYDGTVLNILRKYHLVDEGSSEIKMVEVRENPDNKPKKGDPDDRPSVSAPMLNPDVIDRFLALDTSNKKRNFDWMMWAAAGGKDGKEASVLAIKAAHDWVISNRTGQIDDPAIDANYEVNPDAFEEFARSKGVRSWEELRRKRIPFGFNSDEVPIDPMTPEQAEQDWLAHSAEVYTEAYNYADQDLASDDTYKVFGYYVNWPGRDGIYETVVRAVTAYNGILADKKRLQTYNKTQQKNPFLTSLWNQDGTPLYKTADELLTAAKKFNKTFAEQRALGNKLYFGRAETPEGGWVKSKEGVIYQDENILAAVPATAGAARHDPKEPRSGRLNWCISNHTRWNYWFQDEDKEKFMWGSSSYGGAGPFIFVTFKPTLTDEKLQQVALHCKYSSNPKGDLRIDKIDFWDGENTRAIPFSEIKNRLSDEQNGQVLLASLMKAFEAAKDWYKTLKPCDIELHPALESLARQLVDMMLG